LTGFDDVGKARFVEAIGTMPAVQLAAVADDRLRAAQGRLNRKALGYVYGFIDAALSTIGQDMADIEIGVPITADVLGIVFPGKEASYVTYLANHLTTDKELMSGVIAGGQQCIDFNNGTLHRSWPL
jgi:hypothetical protein